MPLLLTLACSVPDPPSLPPLFTVTAEPEVFALISVPFTVDVNELHARGTTVRVPLRAASAAGFPLPLLLFRFFKEKLPKGLVAFEEPATLVISLERFLPPYVSAGIQKIWIIDGGLAVTLGHGGADLPPSGGTN